MADQVTAPVVAPTPAVAPNNSGGGQVTEPRPAAPPDLYEVKVNGQVKRYTLDQLRSQASIAAAATEKFESASQKERKHEEWKARAQKDAIQALMDPELGLTKDQIRSRFESWYKENFIDPETLTPEQRQAEAWRKEAEEAREEKRVNKERDEKTQQETRDNQLRDHMQQEIIQTLDSSDLQKTRFNANRIAFYMKQNLAKGFDAPPEMVIQQVKEERNSIVRTLVDTSTPEQLVEMLGPELIKKIRQFDLARLKKRFEPTQEGQSHRQNPLPKQGGKTMKDVDSYFNDLRRSKK